MTSNQTSIHSLPECLADEVPLDGTGLEQVKNRPQWASELEALSGLYVTHGQIGIVQYEDAWYLAVTAEIHRHCHVELRWIQIRQIVEAERRMVAVHTLDFLIAVPGPQRPKDKFGPVCRWKQGESIDTAMLANPVPDLDVVRMGVFGESGCLGLLRREESLLLLGNLEKPSRRFAVRLGHNTILQLS